MAEIDSLEIKITAESDKAESSLDRVIKKLESIQNLTKGKGLDGLSKSLTDISTNVQNMNVDRISSGMDKVAQKSVSMSKKVSKNIDEVAKKNKEAADYINSAVKTLQKSPSDGGIGLRDKGAISQVKDQLQGIYDAYRKVAEAVTNNSKVDEESEEKWHELAHAAQETAREFATVKKYVDEVTKSIADYIKRYNAIDIGDLRTEYPGMKDFNADKRRAGKNFYSTKGTDYTQVITDINKEFGLEGTDKAISEDIDGFKRLIEIIHEAKTEFLSFSEARNQFESDPDSHIISIISNLIKMAHASAEASAKVQQTTQAIRDLMMQGQGIPRLTDNISKIEQSFRADIGQGGIKEITPTLETIETRIVIVRDAFTEVANAISEATERVYAFQSALSGTNQQTPLLGNGRDDYIDVPYREVEPDLHFNWDMIDARARQLEEAQEKVNNFSFGKLTASAAVLAGAIDKIGQKLGKLGDLGQKALGFMYIPLKGVVNEYKEKLETIKGHFDDFFKKVKAGLTKLSAFWKRAMRTFTFMILRKAFTQIIKDIHEATESLALFSKEFGTTFNENISNAIADFKWIGKALVGAFEPIINFVVPILNVLSAALVKVITLLGEFFAALTGQGYYMVAKKRVEDYAGSLKKAAKEAKKSIRPFDELNLITSGNKSDDDTGINPAADWDMKPVSDKMKKFADMIKDLAKKLFAPIKAAWDRTKEYVISGFKYMVGELGKLAKSIGRDFLKAWQEEQTIHIFENIFNMVGDIERVVGNFAKNFRKAWDTVVDGETRGYWIFHNILKIIDTITTHLRNVTKYMVEWSDSITFDALLDSFIRLLGALDKVADFIGGVFEDVMKNVVLEYIKWLIEEGTPHLLNTISEIIDAFDFDKIRQDLVPVEKAFEKLLENIHTGVTNAIGTLGKALADWMNSEKFTKFMESLAHIMQQITAERVEKVLEALGLAILRIAEAIADFVSSDKFLNFIDKVGAWLDSKSSEELADYVENIIKLTVAFKGLAAVAPALSSLVKTATMLKTVGNISKIAKGLSTAGTAAKGASTAGKVIQFSTQGEVLAESAGIIAKLQAGLSSIASFFTADIGATMAAGGATAAATFATALIAGVAAAIGGWNLGQLIDKKLNGDEGMGSFTEQMKGIKESFSDGSWKDAFALWGEDIASAWSEIGSNITAKVKETQENNDAAHREWVENNKKTIAEWQENNKQKFEEWVSNNRQKREEDIESIRQWVDGYKQKFLEWQENNRQKREADRESMTQWVEHLKSKYEELKAGVSSKLEAIKSDSSAKLAEIKAKFAAFDLRQVGANIINKLWSGMKSAWSNISSWVKGKVAEFKSKLNFNFSFNSSSSGGGVSAYATGGFPEDGWFRASHGEMIGEFDNGQSVVANNQQIIDGIKAGVIDGMMQILPSLAQAVSSDTNVVIEGDMSKMFRAMVKENYGANKRTFNASPLYS